MKKLLTLFIILTVSLSSSFSITAFADTQDFYIDYDIEKVAMLGGKSFVLTAVGGDDVFWSVHNISLCDISTEGNKVTIFPKSAGIAIISARSGEKTAYAQIKIIDVATEQDAQIIVKEFNRAGEQVTVSFSAQGYSKFYNFQGEWKVFDESNNAVPFIDNGESITISAENARMGNYTVKLSSPGFSPIEKLLKISQRNIDEMLNKYLPVLAIAVTVVLILVILAKRLGTKLNSVYKSFKDFNKNYDKLEEKIRKGVNKLVFTEKITKISLTLKNITGNVQIMNMDGFGYYQKLQDKLMNACSALDASLYYKNYTEDFAKEFVTKFREVYLIPIEELIIQFLAIEKVDKKIPLTKVEEINLNSQDLKNPFVKSYVSLDEILFAGKKVEEQENDDDDK